MGTLCTIFTTFLLIFNYSKIKFIQKSMKGAVFRTYSQIKTGKAGASLDSSYIKKSVELLLIIAHFIK